jgi:hypothetical protein
MRVAQLLLFILYISCKSTSETKMAPTKENIVEFQPQFTAGQPVLVYKTKADYNNFVPVILSDDKASIINYPHPQDLRTGSGYPLPVFLNKGYLLDKRGIGKNVAFIKITYEDYAKLDNAPSLKTLYDLIIDNDPLTELCNCGVKSAFTDQTKQINQLIENNTLRTVCKTIR